MRSLAVFDPAEEFNYIQTQINKLFDEAFRLPTRRYAEMWVGESWGPAVDIYETDDSYILEADLPGMKKEDIHIDVRANVLTLSGERKQEQKVEEDNKIRIERNYGKFVRSFTLPQNVDADHIKASYKDGVLRVILPKTEEARPKQIKIES